jgi:hypothetical protein
LKTQFVQIRARILDTGIHTKAWVAPYAISNAKMMFTSALSQIIIILIAIASLFVRTAGIGGRSS